jgi:glycosyltransferase involved in cell wall biosynthesis
MIESVLAQSRRPDEIVVSDDCSSDDTPEILRAVSAEHPIVRVLRQSKNSGGVPNWSHAVRAASGDLIAWCSDDDRFAPGHLEASVDYLEQHPEVGMVHSGFINAWQDDAGRLIEAPTELYDTVPMSIKGRDLVAYMIRHYSWPFHPSTLVFRRSVWADVGEFDPQYQLADTEWFLRVVVRHRVTYLPRFGAINRRHLANWSIRTGSVRMHDEVDQAVRSAILQLPLTAFERPLYSARWTMFHLYRMARLFVARSRAGRIDIAKDVAGSAARSIGVSQILPSPVVPACAGAMAAGIRRVQQLFPSGVRRYDERAKWEPQ